LTYFRKRTKSKIQSRHQGAPIVPTLLMEHIYTFPCISAKLFAPPKQKMHTP
jgi:hypothetical protein